MLPSFSFTSGLNLPFIPCQTFVLTLIVAVAVAAALPDKTYEREDTPKLKSFSSFRNEFTQSGSDGKYL